MAQVFASQCLLLSKPKSRINSNQFIVEGIKEIKLCFDGKYNFIELFICSEIISQKDLIDINNKFSKVEKTDLSKNLYNQLSYKTVEITTV